MFFLFQFYFTNSSNYKDWRIDWGSTNFNILIDFHLSWTSIIDSFQGWWKERKVLKGNESHSLNFMAMIFFSDSECLKDKWDGSLERKHFIPLMMQNISKDKSAQILSCRGNRLFTKNTIMDYDGWKIHQIGPTFII